MLYVVNAGYCLHLPYQRFKHPGETVDLSGDLEDQILRSQGWKVRPAPVEAIETLPTPEPEPAPGHPDVLVDGAWAGRRCFIIGGGPSLKNLELSGITGELTIGVNRAFELIDPTIIFSMDSRFYTWLKSGEVSSDAWEQYQASPAWKVWIDTHGYQFGAEVQTIKALLGKAAQDSLINGFSMPTNSGAAALRLAIALGANPIYLLGFDLHQNGKRQQWWHDGYKYVQKDEVYNEYLADFEVLAQELTDGSRVININPDSALRCFEFGKMPEPPEKPVMPLFVSFCTPGLYAEKAARLRLSLHRLGLEYRIDEVEDRGSWDANTKRKAEFILAMLEAHPGRNIVWVDADAVVRQYPAMFNDLKGEIGAHYRNGKELLSGTLFFQNVPRVHALVKLWIKENAKAPREWEQRTLQKILAKPGRFGRPRAKVEHLPAIYCQIFDTMADAGKPVIEHYQASREAKGKA